MKWRLSSDHSPTVVTGMPSAVYSRPNVSVPERGWLLLEFFPHVVLNTLLCGRDCVAPHLKHPPEDAVRCVVALQLERDPEPVGCETPKHGQVNEHGRRAAWVHLRGILCPSLDDGTQLWRSWVHVAERETSRHLGRRAVRDRAQHNVICLGN
eukprot:scaffold52997_cov35-Tisochrysis_lutea.AAC.2